MQSSPRSTGRRGTEIDIRPQKGEVELNCIKRLGANLRGLFVNAKDRPSPVG
jgi:hypothetical protein